MDKIDFNVMALAVIAVCNAITALLAWRTHVTSAQTAINVQKVETATNSMKDALVAATGAASHAAGVEQGRREGIATAATLAEGRLAGQQETKS